MNENSAPVCKRLRSRGFYAAEPEEVAHFEFSPESACWCARTVTVLGPDDVLCSLEMCQPGRTCFEAG
jgi:hypothetical protein